MRHRPLSCALAPLLVAGLWGCVERRQAPPEATVAHVAHARAGVHCSRCHVGVGTPRESPDAVHMPTDADCAGCHETSHADMPADERGACTGCHVDPDIPAAAGRRAAQLKFEHGPHLSRTSGECIQCHRGGDGHGPGGMAPTMDDCRGCHETWLDGLACDACHRSLAAYPVRPVSHQSHGAGYAAHHALEAAAAPERCAKCHSQSFCADCHDHRAPLPDGLLWPDRPDRGFVHPLGWTDRHAWEARIEGPLCLGCHVERDCQTCHELAGRGPGGLSPHPEGWASAGPGPNQHAAEARRDLVTCASCHGGGGADLCVTCHAPGRPGGSPHTGTPRGSLNEAPCVRCHRGTP